jgi:hypothetical protein
MSPPAWTMKLGEPGLVEQRRGAIDRVALGDAAQRDLHAGALEPHGVALLVEHHVLPVDQLLALQHLGRIGQRAVHVLVELPQPAVGADGDVEHPAATPC